MREIAFIKQNKSKWLEFEALLLQTDNREPDQMADAYIQLLNDLSYSQTYYPKSKTTEYLNSLVAQIYRKIYKTKRIEKNRLRHFFAEDVPQTVYENRKILLFSFALFFFFVVIGALSAAFDDTFVRVILGDRYVNQTLENIRSGDPMAVYKSDGAVGMSLSITLNNIGVAMKAYILGLTGGILTFFIAMQNGIMLGSFQYFFYEQGVFDESLRAIWLHGAMEIFSIVIATMAGFMLAASYLFPGSYSRIESFKRGARASMKIMVSTMPFFVLAGCIEGFVTRYSNTMPIWLNLLIIFGTLALITYYYIVYPILLNRKKDAIPTLQETNLR